jgi:hypothetical protein
MVGFLLLAVVALLAFFLIRAGAGPRLVVLILVCIFVPMSIALASWFIASPPIWTFFAPRVDAVVQVADIIEPQDGSPARPRRDVIDVRVRLAGERSERLLVLYGVEPPEGSFASRIEAQDALRRDYAVGSTITVRAAGNGAYVDRQDWFLTGVFLFCALYTVLALVIAAVVMSARRGMGKKQNA